MADHPGQFAWYELLTTNMDAAAAFYGDVIGWEAQDASTPEIPYRLFTVASGPASGLMPLPPDALKKGAAPRWVGYVRVDDVDVTAARLKGLGGAIYVPPTDSNIGRISIVADPQTATLALVTGLKVGTGSSDSGKEVGRVGWHELLAADSKRAFAFYGELLNWQKVEAEASPTDSYQLFAAGDQAVGGIFTKLARAPVPFWLYYFNVADITVALERVKDGGGRVAQGPIELPGGTWIARCIDPQGAMFALQGKRSQTHAEDVAPAELAWGVEWGGFASRGRVVAEPSGKGTAPSSKR
jgi:uncharacterized protein